MKCEGSVWEELESELMGRGNIKSAEKEKQWQMKIEGYAW